MSIVIDDPEIERLARDYAARCGEPVEQAIGRLLRAKQSGAPRTEQTERTEAERQARLAEARKIIDRIHDRIKDNPRTADEIIGYDEHGLPR